MKSHVILSLLMASLAFAQSGFNGGGNGLHQMDAFTLGKSGKSVGMGLNIAPDAWAFSRGGFTRLPDGTMVNNIGDNAISFTGALNFAYGILDDVDVGAILPLYYDHAAKDKSTKENGMWSFNRGDLDLWGKYRVPFGDEQSIYALAVMGEMMIPTGARNHGIRPRHPWYLSGDGDYTHPYTSGEFVLGTTGIFSLDLTRIRIPFRWHSYVGFVAAFGDGANTLVYGTGMDFLPTNWVDVFMEFSAETRVEETDYEIDPLADPMLFTPGLRFHLPFNLDFVVALDVSIRYLRNREYIQKKDLEGSEDFMVKYKGDDGSKYYYGYQPAPLWAIVSSFVWRFGGTAERDSDGDGIVDLHDECAHSHPKAVVNSRGCPMDTDNDGIIDGVDLCPKTPAGTKVTANGCPVPQDTVKDSTDRAEKAKTSSCASMTPIDSGAVNHKARASEKVVSPADRDGDGVADAEDRCPETRRGLRVDSYGCPLDSDGDGIYDSYDRCPGTPRGEAVGSDGCVSTKVMDLMTMKQKIQFKISSSTLTSSSYPALDEIVEKMKADESLVMEIHGYTDITGPLVYNVRLSRLRAQTVADYLISKGISSRRVRVVGHGPDNPIGDNMTQSGQLINRRVEFTPMRR